MRQVVYALSAREDFDRIASYIARESGSSGVARAFVAKLRQHCRRLAGLGGQLGTLRPEVAGEVRSTPCGNYIIFFRYDARELTVVRVIEGHRDVGELRLCAEDRPH